MNELKYKEAYVLRFRFPEIFGGEKHTLKQLALMLNLTPERIRHIEANALEKLRWQVADVLGENK